MCKICGYERGRGEIEIVNRKGDVEKSINQHPDPLLYYFFCKSTILFNDVYSYGGRLKIIFSRAEEIVIHELNNQIKYTAGSHIQISCCCTI